MASFNLGNYSSPQVHSATLGDFKGVEYSKSPVNVSSNHASDMRNFIYKDGNIHKRDGYEEMIKLPDRINGYWEFIDTGKNVHRIVHSGANIYKIIIGKSILDSSYTKLNLTYTPSYYSSSSSWSDYLANAIKDRKSYGVVRNNRLYILCGAYLVYGTWDNGATWELRPVRDNEDTYIPTTATNLTNNGQVNPLDEINIMSCRRKNRLIGADFKNTSIMLETNNKDNSLFDNDTEFSTISSKYAVKITSSDYLKVIISFINSNGKKVVIERYFDGVNKTFKDLSSCAEVTIGVDDYNEQLSGFRYIESYDSNKNLTLTIMYGTSGEISNISTFLYNNECCYTFDSKNISDNVDFLPKVINTDTGLEVNNAYYTIKYEKGQIEFRNCDLTPLIHEYPNIEVEFTTQAYLDNKKWESIDNCTFGTILSYNDLDTLFISGNSNLPNYDFHTCSSFSFQQGSISNYENLTYFGELGYAMLGNPQTAITGYSLLNDSTLGVHKAFSTNETCFYIRQAKMSNATDVSGAYVYLQDGETIAQTVSFPQFATGIGEGCISNSACKTLVNDKLILSSNGVFGIELSESVKTNERYAKQRSSLIDDMLKKEDLSNASAIVHDGKYYLYVGGKENKVYVADSRFRNYNDKDLRDTFSYEWSVLNNIDAQVWYVDVNNDLWFGTRDGRLCKFTKDKFEDITYEKISCSYNGDNKFTLTDGKYENNNYICFQSGIKLYEKLITLDQLYGEEEYSRFIYDELYDSTIKYCLGCECLLVKNDTQIKCTLKEDTEKRQYITLYGEDGNQLSFNGFVMLLKPCINEKLLVEDNGDVYLQSYSQDLFGNVLDKNICSDEGFAPNFANGLSYIKNAKPIVSYWYTPAMSLGTYEFTKSIQYISTLFQPVNNGQVTIGYKTRISNNDSIMYDAYGGEGVDIYNGFNNLTFENFSFSIDGIAKSYTFKKKIKNFILAQLFFLSNNNADCIVNSITLSYTIGTRNRGVN